MFKFLFTPPDADPGAPPEADGVPLGPDDPEAGTDDAGDPVEVPRNNQIIITWKYPMRGYILGVLTHTTAWDQLW